MHRRLVPDGKGGFKSYGDKSWKAEEGPKSGEVFVNFGAKNENEGEANEGCSKPKRSRAKRSADGASKNSREDENGSLLVTVVTPKRSDKDKESVSCHDVIRDIAAWKPHYLGNGHLRSAKVIEEVIVLSISIISQG